MSKSKKKKALCDCRCIYFPQDPSKIIKERIVDGVKQRETEYRCAYDESLIRSWKKECPRKGGPCVKESDHERWERLKKEAKNGQSASEGNNSENV